MGNWESQVASIRAEELDLFIQKTLKPYDNCLKQLELKVAEICRVLLEAPDSPRVLSVAKGGPYGRETDLRGKSYGRLVLFLDHLEQFQDLKKSQRSVMDSIKQRLLRSQPRVGEIQSTSSERLFIQVSTWYQEVLFELVPAFKAVDPKEKPSPSIYRNLKRAMDETRASPGEFAVCFTELQKKFFDKYPRKLKDLILLIKYWYQQCQNPMPNAPYALELLTVYAWEQGCGSQDFDIAEGVRTVLGLLQQPEQLCIYWTVNYDFEDVTVRNVLLSQLRSQRPVILDPTDPTDNVSKNVPSWQKLKEDAQIWLSSPTLNSYSSKKWNVLPAPLFVTPGHLLDKFIKDFLQPNKDFLEPMQKAVDDICTFLKNDCFRHSTTKIQKVVKGGSAAKGTALKTGSDADLVVFPSSLGSYTSQKNERSKIIQEIQKQLGAWAQRKQFEVLFEMSKWKEPRVLSFSLKAKHGPEKVDFDVLPAFNALGQLHPGATPRPGDYWELIDLCQSSKMLGGEFSTCFTELQRNFIMSKPTKLKDLIRLVKHWYKQCERKMKPKGSLPPKYALELLTVYAWEHGSGMSSFSTAEGFRTVLELVMQYQELCIFWTVNYNYKDEKMRKFLLSQMQKTRPLILDPAEPTGDVGGGNRWCWHFLAKEAEEWLSSPCFKDGSGNPIQPWRVPVCVMI